MKKGFDFFRTRKSSILDKIDFLEKEYKIVLPPLYKLFMETFDVGDQTCHIKTIDGTLCKPTFEYEKSIEMGGNKIDIVIGNFHSIEESFQYWQSGMGSDTWLPYEIFDIAYGWSGSLRIYIGIGRSNLDEIWIDDWDSTIVENPTKIADNIFKFIKMFKEWNMSDYYYADKLDRLYQKWGEDFWRLSPVPLQTEGE